MHQRRALASRLLPRMKVLERWRAGLSDCDTANAMTMILERDPAVDEEEDKDLFRPIPNYPLALAFQELGPVVAVADLTIIHLMPMRIPVAQRQKGHIKPINFARLSAA